MNYIDGFVIAVPTATKQRFIKHAEMGDSVFMDFGALRVLECWGDDVPDAAMTKLMEMIGDPSKADPRMDPEKNPLPFDGKRLILDGFAPVVSLQK